MKKSEPNAHPGKSGPRTRIGAKVLTAVATLALVASMCPGTVALAYANEQLAAGSAGLETQDGGSLLSAQADDDTLVNAQTVSADTHKMGSGAYRVTGNATITPDGSGNGIQVEKDARVLLFI